MSSFSVYIILIFTTLLCLEVFPISQPLCSNATTKFTIATVSISTENRIPVKKFIDNKLVKKIETGEDLL